MGLVIKKKKKTNTPPAKTGDVSNSGSIPGLGRFLGGGHGNPLQCSCLENPMDGGWVFFYKNFSRTVWHMGP